MNYSEVIESIFEYEHKIGLSENMLQGNLLPLEEKEFLIKDPNAFLFGLISDQSVKAETAWSLPYKLFKRLGYFSMDRIIADNSVEDIQSLIHEKPALHRYPSNIGKYLWLAAKKIHEEYEDSAANIWNNVVAAQVVERFESFSGISHKKASLGCLLLVRDLDVSLTGLEVVDIAYDVHIRRIFLRAGFCEKDTLKDVTDAARNIYPKFPGYLTSAFWAIGREICRPTNPDCNKCPINVYCKKEVK